MHPEFIKWLSEQKYTLIRNSTSKYYWAVRKDAIWSWYEITNDDYR